MSFRECTQVTPQCPVEATTYGYYPNLPGNAILLAVFAAVTVAQGILGLFYRLPSFGSVVTIACAGEAIGYGGRIMMHSNPWSDAGFKIQIVCLILSPSFLAAGIYLTLKHVVMAIGPQYSRLKPNLYTWIFISCDAGSILLQAAGGGVASAGDGNIVNVGNSIMIAGIAFQVATMTVCLILAVDFAVALWKGNVLRRTTPESSESEGAELEKTTTNSAKTNKFYYYLTCSFIAFIAIYVRCIYRLPEMSGGWGNPVMRNEKDFLILDGAMIALASILMTIAHPGPFFPAMRLQHQKRVQQSKKQSKHSDA